MTSLQIERSQAASQLEALVTPLTKKPTKRTGPQVAKIQRDMEKIAEIVKDEKLWVKLTPALYVALYAWLHQQVYGIDPSAELASKVGLGARSAATNILKNEFNGNAGEMLMFMRWTWFREREREEWRKANNRQGGRITWRVQFSHGLVNEYRLMRRREVNKMPVTRVTREPVADDRTYSLSM